jgi:hypothetical protein
MVISIILPSGTILIWAFRATSVRPAIMTHAILARTPNPESPRMTEDDVRD